MNLWRGHLLALAMGLGMMASASAAEKVSLLGSAGANQKYDVSSRHPAGYHFGVITTYDGWLEAQVLLKTGTGYSSGVHASLGFHAAFFKGFEPFITLGPGIQSTETQPFHLNLDVGFQIQAERYLIRLFHKTQNRFWGANGYKYAQATYLLAIGYNFSIR